MHIAHEDTTAWYRQFWPWFLISLPAATVVAAMFTIGIAVNSDDGLVVDDYYKRGLAIHRDAAQRETAMSMRLTGAAALASDGVLRVRLAADRALGDTLILRAIHPTRAGLDQEIVLQRDASGQFVGRVQPLADANWHITVLPTSAEWRLDGRVTLPDGGEFSLQ